MDPTRLRNLISATLAILLLAVGQLKAQDDVVLRAMRDELARSMKQLELEKLEKPYFIAYRVQEKHTASAVATFGALLTSSSLHQRFLTVEVRVGSTKLDNTNFVSMSFLNRGGLAGGFGGVVQLPLEGSYKEIRRQIWLATDSAYKKALEDLSRKRAALQDKTSTEEIADFSSQVPATITEAAAPVKIDTAQLESLARNLSGVFAGSPNIFIDSAQVTMEQTYTRYVNSEGATFTRDTPVASVVLLAETQAEDGAPVRDFLAEYGHSLEDLPGSGELENRARTMGEQLEKLRTASVVDHYNGPVLFEGQAAAELINQVIGAAVLARRPPVSDIPQFDMVSSQMGNPFQDRIGSHVLPDFLSVTDDPTLRRYQNKPLQGTFRVDDDGVPAQRTALVVSGTLKTLLASRDPIARIAHSTGSRRGGSVAPSNLLVTVTQGLTDQALKAKLLSMVRQQEIPFGIVIDRVANPMLGDPKEMMTSLLSSVMPGRDGGGSTQVVIVAHKVFPDGHEELVRNVAIDGLSTATFKDVMAASASSFFYTTPFLSMRNSVFSVLAGGSLADTSPPLVTLVVPSLLIDDVTLKRSVKEMPKPPFSPRPVGN